MENSEKYYNLIIKRLEIDLEKSKIELMDMILRLDTYYYDGGQYLSNAEIKTIMEAKEKVQLKINELQKEIQV